MIAVLGAMGVTAGAHRLWAHKAYKAKWQFRLILATFQAMAFQVNIIIIMALIPGNVPVRKGEWEISRYRFLWPLLNQIFVIL